MEPGTTILKSTHNTARDPLQALLARPEGAVLALIAGVEGPSYRPVGAMMTLFGENDRAGTLSSGCIEADIALHAKQARENGAPVLLRYGRGSPFVDIDLPCGGGLDILLLPRPDLAALKAVAANRALRRPCTLGIDLDRGAMTVRDSGDTARDSGHLSVRFEPDIQFLIFGKGPEASTFAALVQSAGYPSLVLSPDPETLADCAAAGSAARHLTAQAFPRDLVVDDRTAILLFFHDHDWEPPVLQSALATPAFYIGAQGSMRARDARLMTLAAMGVERHDRERLHGPIGMIRSARDAGTLAVSVLAEVLDVEMRRGG